MGEYLRNSLWLNTSQALILHRCHFSSANVIDCCCAVHSVIDKCAVCAADDHQALIWDIQQMPRAIEDPILAYTAAGEINQIQWSSTQPDWIAICYNNCLEILRV
jgi:hypothetical protein